MRWVLDLPLFVVLMGIGALAMLVPAAHAFVVGADAIGRVFVYGALASGVVTALIAVATVGLAPSRPARAQLLSLGGAFLLLPVFFAWPFYEAVRPTTPLNAWFEMVSCFTTTGATLYPADRLPPSVHLWRAIVGWLGGFLVWVTAVALLAPMNLGGFEVRAEGGVGRGAAQGAAGAFRRGEAGRRIVAVAMALLPVYAGLTTILWLLMIVSGSPPTAGLIHAMSTLSTSGIMSDESLRAGGATIASEVIIVVFLVFALSRNTYTAMFHRGYLARLKADHELRLGLLVVSAVTAFLFLRHWIGATEIGTEAEQVPALAALWGTIFTVLSFLTTTGFVSEDWVDAQNWSGLSTPGLLLMGLAVFGGGVGTTAGGVKLLRVWALYTHTTREMERLIHPSSVGGSGREARRLRREGAEIAWIFFMLVATSIAIVSTALAAAGLDFESAIALAVAALSTTGPLAEHALARPIDLMLLGDGAKAIMVGAMVLGRLETLALIALLNPEFWRN
jgi:trk system potassium uptake protein TrkH